MKPSHLLSVVLLGTAATLFAAGPATTKPAATRPVASRPVAPVKGKPDAADAFFASGPLPRLRIDVDPREMKRLNDRPKEHIRAIVREVTPGQPDVVYC